MPKHEGETVRLYLRENKISQEALAQQLGVARNTIINYLKLEKLSEEFKGQLRNLGYSPFANAQSLSNAQIIDLGDRVIKNVPLVSQYAYAGYLNGYADAEFIEALPTVPFIVDKEPKGNYVAFEVKGDSMDDGSSDSYLPGDILLCREIKSELWKSKLHIKKWDFVIVHRTKGIVFKRIADHNLNNGHLKLHSLNPEYEDFEVKLDDVRQVLNVVQVMRKK